MLKRAQERVLNEIIDRIVLITNPDKIILFGSRAKGTANKNSDYDVLILKKYARKKSLRQKLYKIGLTKEAPVDILVNTPIAYEKLKEKLYYVYHDISKFGIVVYEKAT